MSQQSPVFSAMNWDDLKVFLAVASAGSVRAAAPVLGVNQSTISRRIHSLEKELNTNLFEKLPSGYSITEVGKAVLDHARRIADEFSELNQNIFSRNTDLAGTVRLTVCSPFLSNLMMRDLAEFGHQYPGIKIEIISAEHELNLSKREADVAIRVTNSPPEHLIGRRISGYAQSVYASRDYVQKFVSDQDLSRLRWLSSLEAKPLNQALQHTTYAQALEHHFIDDMSLQYEAAKAGMGMALLPCFIGDRAENLEPMPQLQIVNNSAVWILMHPDSRKNARIQTFYSYMREKLLDYAPLFEGSQAREQFRQTKQFSDL